MSEPGSWEDINKRLTALEAAWDRFAQRAGDLSDRWAAERLAHSHPKLLDDAMAETIARETRNAFREHEAAFTALIRTAVTKALTAILTAANQ